MALCKDALDSLASLSAGAATSGTGGVCGSRAGRAGSAGNVGVGRVAHGCWMQGRLKDCLGKWCLKFVGLGL